MVSRKAVRTAALFIAIVIVGFLAWFRLRAPHVATIAMPSGPAIDARVVERVRPGAIAGAVRSKDRSPIAGASVCATSTLTQLSDPKSTCAASKDDGSYAIEGLSPGGYFVMVHAAGYLPSKAREGRPIVIASGELVANVDLELDPGGARMTGYVVDVTGGPVPGATIEATFVTNVSYSIAVSSAADGSFSFSAPPGPVDLIASASGYATVRVAHIAPSSDLVIEMVPGSTVRGIVVSDEGKPVAGVDVQAIPIRGGLTPVNPSAVSNAAGEFTIETLETGEYGLRGEGDGWLGQSEGPIALGIAQSLSGVKVVVRPAAHLHGKVTTSHGEPCRLGLVMIGQRGGMLSHFDPPSAVDEVTRPGPPVPPAMAPIEADGSVHFRGIAPGSYHVVVQCEGYLLTSGPSALDVPRTGVDDVRWKVAPAIALTIRVVDEANRPVPGAPFQLKWPDRGHGTPQIVMPLTADAAGRYEMQPILFPGSYTIEPEAGYEAESMPVELKEGVAKVEVPFHIKGRGSILVTVRDTDSHPVDSVQVSAKVEETSDDGRFQSAVPLGNGQFKLAPLSPRAYVVVVADELNPQVRARVEVANGAEAQSTIVFDRGASLRGRVVDDRNLPAPDVWVDVDCTQRDQATQHPFDLSMQPVMAVKRVVSDSQGRFVVSGVSAQTTCQLRAEEPYGSVSKETLARPGEDALLSLQATGVLAGTAKTADGSPVNRFQLILRYADTGQMRTELVMMLGDAWKLGKVVAGDIEIRGYDESGNSAQLHVQLAPGQSLNDIRLTFQPTEAAHLQN